MPKGWDRDRNLDETTTSCHQNEYCRGKKIKACGPGFWTGWSSSPSDHLLLPETGFGICCSLDFWIPPWLWEMGNQDTHLHREEHTAAGWGRWGGQGEIYSGLKMALGSTSLSIPMARFPR